MITKSLTLDLIPGRNNVTIPVSQYDSDSRIYEITVLEGDTEFEVPDGSTVTVRGTKVDNTGFEYPCTYAGSLVKMTIKQQMTLFAGPVYCELRIVNQGKILGSANFTLLVEPTTLKGDVEISDTDLPLIEQATELAAELEKLYPEMEELAGDVEKAKTDSLSALQSSINLLDTFQSETEKAIDEIIQMKSVTYGYSFFTNARKRISLRYLEEEN